MSVIVLDTLEYATKLKAGGFTDQQAETQARALAEVVEKQLVTQEEVREHESNLRRDIETLRLELKRDIETLRLEVKHDIDVLRAEFKKDIAESKAELIRWVVGVGILQTTLIIGILARLAKVI
ncbi:MAG: CCDC90 family protein [Candidatus Contendobacter sp.]|nr:CCDC90 family protein [Candidatus Contendobacter sp.]